MADSPSRLPDPYVVLRGAGDHPWYRRRIPPALKATIGASTITKKLAGHPRGAALERAAYASSYARAHGAAEELLDQAARGKRVLTPVEALGVAGAWAKTSGPQDPDPTGPEEAAAVLRTLVQLALVLPPEVPEDWRPEITDDRALVIAAQHLAGNLDSLAHPNWINPPHGGLLDGGGLEDPSAAAAFIAETVRQAREPLGHWLAEARRELVKLGVIVAPDQHQAVALKLAQTAAALSLQTAAIEAGRFPEPLIFPAPPVPEASKATFEKAVQRWEALRAPTAKTINDARARLASLAASSGTDDPAKLTREMVIDWRNQLLQAHATATAKKHLAIARAVLVAASADGMEVSPLALDALRGTGLRASGGTSRQRRPFTADEAATLIEVSRQQQGRPFDRWGLPLGLAIGGRIEELVGLRPGDIRQIDGLWVVVVEPHESRRLKNNASARVVPIPDALIREGFVNWAQQQDGPQLFPEPDPPSADPRLSHYASIRLGKIIRKAGIGDPCAVFHSCRHFASQALVDAGAEQRLVEQILGHGTKATVARYSRAGIPIPLLAAAMESRDWRWWPELPGPT